MSENRMIIVDDNIAFCQAMSFMIKALTNLEILVYHNANLFLKEYSSAWKGYLLIDLLMPNIDGLSLLEELKKLETRLHIIVISGHADKDLIAKAKQFGAHEFLLKPFDVKKILEKIP